MSTTLDVSLRDLDARSTDPESERSLAIEAHGLQLDGKRGRIYGPLDLSIAPGTVTVLTGKSGTGRTSLLLTLTGRLKPNPGGDLMVLGHRLPRQARAVQHRSAATGVAGLDDLDEEVTVAATIREREAWLAPWFTIVRTPDDERVAEVCSDVFGDSPVPRARQLVHELDQTANLQLRIALALLSSPDLVVVDDIDQLHDTEGRRLVWQSLRHLSELGITVVAAASSPAELNRLGWHTLPGLVALSTH